MQIFAPGHVQPFPFIIAVPLIQKNGTMMENPTDGDDRTTGGGRDGRERRRDRGKEVRRN